MGTVPKSSDVAFQNRAYERAYDLSTRCEAENGPTAHEAPIIVLFSSYGKFREMERYYRGPFQGQARW